MAPSTAYAQTDPRRTSRRFVPPPDKASGWTELSLDRALTNSAESYARAHLSALPRVVLAREESTWGLGNQGFQLALAVYGGRNRAYEQLGGILYWISVPFALFGAVVLARRSRARFLVVIVPIAVVVLNVALTYGDTRFRVAAEPSRVVLAAIGAVALADAVKVARARVDGCFKSPRPRRPKSAIVRLHASSIASPELPRRLHRPVHEPPAHPRTRAA